MNLTPEWAGALEEADWKAVHWSQIGNPGAADQEVMDWARSHEHILFTHDLDFGALLAASQGRGPSVIQPG